MAWVTQSINLNYTGQSVLAFLSNRQHKLVAQINTANSQLGNFEALILAAVATDVSNHDRDGKQLQAKQSISDAIKAAERERRFTATSLQPCSVILLRTENGELTSHHQHDMSSYERFRSLLKRQHGFFAQDESNENSTPSNQLLPFEDIVYREPLASWRMTSSKVAIAASPDDLKVYKGFTLYHFLVHGVQRSRSEIAACYREIEMVNRIISAHPHIIPPAHRLVYASTLERANETPVRLICGSLYNWYAKGSLADLLDRSVQDGQRFPPGLKARWCLQLCRAMHHVHHVARNWHQDLKPPNILLDDQLNVVVIDWEQCGANPFVLAPEADGTLDVRQSDEETIARPRLVYERYAGPERMNQAVMPYWNVFPAWNKEFPLACELAEVYSLGRTMWVILEQVGLERQHGVTDYSTQSIRWTQQTSDIPMSWKSTVSACMADDPNTRPLMSELMTFWSEQAKWFSFD